MEIKVKANDFVALFSQTLKRKVIGKVADDSVSMASHSPRTRTTCGSRSIPSPSTCQVRPTFQRSPAERRQPHHSKFELIRTDEVLEERRDSLIKVVDVKKFQDFMKAFKSPREAVPHLEDVQISDETIDDFEHFFFR